MNLGLESRKAIVMASSKGLGKACALALAQEGVATIVINGRHQDTVEAARDEISSQTGAGVLTVVGDVTTDDCRARLLQACAEPDILITNDAGPPPGELADWDHDAWLSGLEHNLLAQALMIRAVVPGMRQRRFGRIINLTSAMVKAPFPMLGLSTAARSGLVAFSKAVSLTTVVDNVTINNLLPERFDTGRTHALARRDAEQKGITYDQAIDDIRQSIAAKRLGRPEEYGAACAFLCSDLAGYICGQNLSLDGGTYPGIF